MSVKKSRCVNTTKGRIVKLNDRGIDSPTIITVDYIVHGKTYTIRESLKLKSVAKKFGPFTIGQKKVPVLPETNVNSKVFVSYNPNNPAEAYLRDNVGKVNC